MDDLSQIKILLIEDQLETRMALRNMLVELGVNQIFESKNGREGKDLMDIDPTMVDLIICDWNMPEMTGIELLQYIRPSFTNMPFLMITGRNDIESVIEAKESGVNGYIKKPFSLNELENKILSIMHKFNEEDKPEYY